MENSKSLNKLLVVQVNNLNKFVIYDITTGSSLVEINEKHLETKEKITQFYLSNNDSNNNNNNNLENFLISFITEKNNIIVFKYTDMNILGKQHLTKEGIKKITCDNTNHLYILTKLNNVVRFNLQSLKLDKKFINSILVNNINNSNESNTSSNHIDIDIDIDAENNPNDIIEIDNIYSNSTNLYVQINPNSNFNNNINNLLYCCNIKTKKSIRLNNNSSEIINLNNTISNNNDILAINNNNEVLSFFNTKENKNIINYTLKTSCNKVLINRIKEGLYNVYLLNRKFLICLSISENKIKSVLEYEFPERNLFDVAFYSKKVSFLFGNSNNMLSRFVNVNNKTGVFDEGKIIVDKEFIGDDNINTSNNNNNNNNNNYNKLDDYQVSINNSNANKGLDEIKNNEYKNFISDKDNYNTLSANNNNTTEITLLDSVKSSVINNDNIKFMWLVNQVSYIYISIILLYIFRLVI